MLSLPYLAMEASLPGRVSKMANDVIGNDIAVSHARLTTSLLGPLHGPLHGPHRNPDFSDSSQIFFISGAVSMQTADRPGRLTLTKLTL